MADNTRDVELRLTAKTAGTEDIQKLAKELQDLAKQGGDAAPEFTRLAQEVAKIGQQVAAVDTLAKLRAEVGQLGDEQRDAADKADRLKVALDALSKVTEQATATQAAEKQALIDTRRALAEKRDELEKLKAETTDAGKREAAYQEQAKQLKLEILQAKQALRDKAEALGQAADAAKRAGAEEDALARQYNAAAKEARTANAALTERRNVMQQADAAAKASGVATDDLAKSQADLVRALQATSAEAREFDAMLTHMTDQSERSSQALRALADAEMQAADRAKQMARDTKAALATLGVDAFNPIEREIEQIQTALAQLGKDATISASVFEKAYNTASERVALLRRELDGTAKAERDAIEGLKILDAMQAEARKSAEALAKSEAEFAAKLREAENIVRASAIADELNKQEAAAKAVEAQAKRTADAFNTVGLKNRAAIEAEIKRVEAALDVLARNTRVTGDEFDRAFTLGQGKIKALRDELDNVQPQMARGAGGVRLFSSAMGELAAVFGAYEAGSFVVKAVNDLEQMRRVLTLVTGSSEKAAQQIEFLRDTANQAGVDFGTISGEFSKFNASMLAAGVSMKTTNEVFATVTKSAGILGQSSVDTEASLRALAQMASKGKVSMEELGQQLGERMPAVLSVTAKSLGLTTSELMKLMETGSLLADEEFFSAFARGVENTFVKGAGEIKGMRAEWNRFVGALTEGVQVLSDGAIGRSIGVALGGIGETLKYLIFTATMVGESFTVMGQQIGTIIAALVTRDFGNLKTALADIQEQSDAKMTALVGRMQGLQTATQNAGGAVVDMGAKTATAGQQMQSAATGAQVVTTATGQAAAAAQSNAAAQTASGAATAAAGATAATVAQSWSRLAVDYKEAESAAQDKVRVSEDLARASKVEAESLVTIAKMTGDVTAQRQIEAQAAQQALASEVALRNAKVDQLEVLNQEIAAMQAYIVKNGDANGSRAKAVEGVREKVKALEAEIERNNAAVTSSQIVVTQRQAEAAAMADNSARVKEYGDAYDAAKAAVVAAGVEMDRAKLRLAEGKGSQEGVNAATRTYVEAAQKAAGASVLYRDALSDATHAAQLHVTSISTLADRKAAGLKLDQQSLEVSARVAAANGNERESTELTVLSKMKAIDVERASQQAKVDGANATIAALEQQRNEITGTDDLSDAKREEIRLRIEAQRTKILEAQGSDAVVRGLNAEISALQRKNQAQDAGQIGKRADPVGADDRASRLSGQNAVDGSGVFILQDKLNKGTLTADDAALVAAVAAAAKQNAEISQGANPGALSQDFMRSLEMQTNIARRGQEALAGIDSTSTTPSFASAQVANVDAQIQQLTSANDAIERQYTTRLSALDLRISAAERSGSTFEKVRLEIEKERTEVEQLNARAQQAQQEATLAQQRTDILRGSLSAGGITPEEQAQINASGSGISAKQNEAERARAELASLQAQINDQQNALNKLQSVGTVDGAKNVTVVINGKKQTIATANSLSADTLVSVLRELESAQSTSGY